MMEQATLELVIKALVNSLRLRTLESCILTSPKYDFTERQEMRDEAAEIERLIRQALKEADPTGELYLKYDDEWRGRS